MRMAASLAGDRPALSRVLSPVAGVGDKCSDPKKKKWAATQHPQRPADRRARQDALLLFHGSEFIEFTPTPPIHASRQTCFYPNQPRPVVLPLDRHARSAHLAARSETKRGGRAPVCHIFFGRNNG